MKLSLHIRYDFVLYPHEVARSPFTLIREDGTRIDFTKEEFIDGYNSATTEETIGNMWTVSGIDSNGRFGGGFQEKDGESTLTYNFGYILGLNEKVKIEANGNIYE
ncbi:MAG: hypothetical protein IK014_13005 [Lachnospiraceae bacterium]|nr:hypothetical protein [Lachnospiraceae bacterium]